MTNSSPSSSTLMAPPDPALDGKTHINVHYNHGTTKLGRMLSTFFVARFEHPYFGPFKCIEGFRLYVLTGCQDDEFRNLTGTQAKSHYRRQLDAGKLKNYLLPHAATLLLTAYHMRLTQHPVTATLFKESTLPFDSYYLYPGSGLPIRPQDATLLIQTLTTLRELMQEGKTPPGLSNEEYAKMIIR